MNVPHNFVFPAEPPVPQATVVAPQRAEITVPQLALVQAVAACLPWLALGFVIWWVFHRKRK